MPREPRLAALAAAAVLLCSVSAAAQSGSGHAPADASAAELLKFLRGFAAGDRVGLITAGPESLPPGRATPSELRGIAIERHAHATTFAEWKAAYLAIQGSVDILFLHRPAEALGWNPAEAAAFVLRNGRVPSASLDPADAPFVLAVPLARPGGGAHPAVNLSLAALAVPAAAAAFLECGGPSWGGPP